MGERLAHCQKVGKITHAIGQRELESQTSTVSLLQRFQWRKSCGGCQQVNATRAGHLGGVDALNGPMHLGFIHHLLQPELSKLRYTASSPSDVSFFTTTSGLLGAVAVPLSISCHQRLLHA